MGSTSALTQLVAYCHSTSRVPWWTQGAGSNLSVKDGDTLYIKASGKRLDEVNADTGVAALGLADLRARLGTLLRQPQPPAQADAAYRAALHAARHASAATPSMETGMHALLPGREVLHLHALLAVVLADWVRQGNRAAVDALMAGAGLGWRYIPATLPGWALAEAIGSGEATDALLLQNHGLILQGDAASLLTRWRAVEAALSVQLGPLADAAAAPGAMRAAWTFTPARAFASTPDVAVFAAAIEAVTEPAPGAKRRLRKDAYARDANAAELWAAHVAMAHLAPQLAALPPSYVARVSALPQEKLRQAQIAKDTGASP